MLTFNSQKRTNTRGLAMQHPQLVKVNPRFH